MRRVWVLSVALLACPKEEKAVEPKPQPVAQVVDAGAPEPKVELPPAPEVPKSPLGLPEREGEKPSAEMVALGHMLFFDKRLSKDGTMSCESCHHIEKGYTSGNALDGKMGGAVNKRNAPAVTNLAWHINGYYWDARAPTLEAVSLAAWKGQLGADAAEVAKKLNAIPAYKAHFQRAFGSDATPENITQALAAFFLALQSGNSPWDRFEAGQQDAVSKEAQEGFEVFKKAGCALCHAPPLYTDWDFHNVGIGWDPKEKKFADEGRKDATKDEKDIGKFKTPSLRDVAKTAPYFHDGSVATLEEAIELMASGGKKNPHLDPKLKPAKLTKKQKAALKAFLESLSGEVTFTAAPQLP